MGNQRIREQPVQHNLEVGHIHREEVKESIIQQTLGRVVDAGKQIRDLNLPKHEKWCTACSTCDMAGICRTKPAAKSAQPK